MYRATGLTPSDDCTIGYAGKSDAGNSIWKLYWTRNGEVMLSPDAQYDSPEDALLVVAGERDRLLTLNL